MEESAANATVASRAALQPHQAHLWRVTARSVDRCRGRHADGSLLLELWESGNTTRATFIGTGSLAAVLTPKQLDPTWDLGSAAATQVDGAAARAQLSYQRVWSARLSATPQDAQWSVAVLNMRHDAVGGYHLRLTCGGRLPCPEPVLGQGRCSGRGSCVTPADEAQPEFCACQAGWADFGCSVEAPLLDPTTPPQPTLAPSGTPSASGTYQRTLFRLQVPQGVDSLLLQLATHYLGPDVLPARPQLCIMPAPRAANATAPLPPAAFNCTAALPSGYFPPLQYLSLGSPCFAGTPPAACLQLQGPDVLVALVNHDPVQPATVSLQPLWSTRSLAVCPAGCSARGPCLLTGTGGSKCSCTSLGYTGEYCQHLLLTATVGSDALAATGGAASDVTLEAGQAVHLVVALAPGVDPWTAPFWVRLRLVGLVVGAQALGEVQVRVRRAVLRPPPAEAYRVFLSEGLQGSLDARLTAAPNGTIDDDLSAQVSTAIRQQLQAVGPQGAALLQVLNPGGRPVRVALELGPPAARDQPAGGLPAPRLPNWRPLFGLDWKYLLLLISVMGAALMAGLMVLLRLSMMRQLRRIQERLLAEAAARDSAKGVPPDVIATFPTFSFNPPATTTAAEAAAATAAEAAAEAGAAATTTASAARGTIDAPGTTTASTAGGTIAVPITAAVTGAAAGSIDAPASTTTSSSQPAGTVTTAAGATREPPPGSAASARAAQPEPGPAGSDDASERAAAGARCTCCDGAGAQVPGAPAAVEGQKAGCGEPMPQGATLHQPVSGRPPAEPPACTVCLAEYEAGDRLRRLPCGHDFHVPCIDSWLASHSSCPICRLDLLPHADRGPSAAVAAAGGSSRTSSSSESDGAGIGAGGGVRSSSSYVGPHGGGSGSGGGGASVVAAATTTATAAAEPAVPPASPQDRV